MCGLLRDVSSAPRDTGYWDILHANCVGWAMIAETVAVQDRRSRTRLVGLLAGGGQVGFDALCVRAFGGKTVAFDNCTDGQWTGR